MNHPRPRSTALIEVPARNAVSKFFALSISLAVAVGLQSVQAATYSWDPSLTPTTPSGGAGTWDIATTANWSDGSSDNQWSNSGNDIAVFGGSAGTVALSGALNALGVQFLTPGYTLSSGTLTLGASGVDASSLTSGVITMSSPIVLGAAQSWNIGSGASLQASGVISGANALTKAGGGTLTLSAVNTFSGGLTISSGTVSVSANTALGGAGGTAGAIALNGGTLQINTSAGGITNTHVMTVGVNGGTILPLSTGAAQAYNIGSAGNLTGSGQLTVSGAGSLTLAASAPASVLVMGNSNTGFSGGITITNGALIEDNNATAIPTSGIFTINSLGLLSANSVTIAQAIHLNDGGYLGFQNNNNGVFSGAITLSGSTSVRMQDWWGSTVRNGSINGVISGSGGLNLNSGSGSGGVLTLNAVDTYSGATSIRNSTLQLGSANTVPNIASSDVTANSGAFVFGTTTSTANVTTTIAKSLTLNSGTAQLLGLYRAPTDQFTNDLTLGSGGNLLAVDGAQNGVFGSQVKFSGVTRSNNSTVLFRAAHMGANTNINSSTTGQPENILFTNTPTLTGGGGALTTTTTSIVRYAIGDNGYAQGTQLLTSGLGTDFVSYNPSGGTGAGLQLLTTYANSITSGATALNNVKITDTSATGINASTTINSLILNSAAAVAGTPGTSSIDGTGTLTINSGAVMTTTTSAASSNGGTGGNYGGRFINNATIGASGLTLDFGTAEGIVTVVGSSTLTLASTSGGISGTGGLTKAGAGDLNLNAAGSLSGNVVINAGRIVLGNSNALQNATLNYSSQGGSLNFGTQTAATLGGLSGTQNLALSNASSGAVAMTVGNNNGSTSYSGVLSGGGSLTKAGSGTLTLTGTDTYTGTTTINGGVLKLAGASLSNSASVAVNGGGTLAASGASANTIAGLVTLAGSSSSSGQGGIDLTADAVATTVLNLNGGLTIGGNSSGAVSLLSFDLAASGSNADLINLGSGTLTGNIGGAVINIGSVSLNNATYTLMKYGNISGFADASTLTIGTHPNQLFTNYTLSLTNTSGAGSLLLTVAGTPVPNIAYWTGGRGGSYNWGDNDGVSATNWATNQAGTIDAGQLAGATTDVVYAADNASAGSLTTNLETNYTVNSLTVLGSGVAASTVPVVSGTGKLTLNANASGIGSLGYAAGKGIVLNSGAAGLTINTTGGVALASNQSWTNNSANTLSVSSNVNGLAVSGTTTLTLDGAGAGSTLISGTIGDGSLGGKTGLAINRTGSGPVVLSGSNTYTGATTISSGVVQPQTANAFGSTSRITVGTGGALELQGGLAIGNTPLTLNGTGNFLSPDGALRNVSGSNSYGGLVTLGSDATIVSDSGTLSLTNGGTITGSGKNLTLAGAGNGSISSIIGTGAGGVTMNSIGTWTLSGASTYTGTTTINSGTLSLSGNNNLGGNSAPVSLNGGTVSTTAAITNTHPFTIGANGGAINVTTSGQYFFNTASTLLGSGTLTVNGTGSLAANLSNLRVAQTNPFSGTVAMQNGGIFEYGIAGAVGSTAGFILNNQSELSVNAGVTLPNNINVNGGTNSVLSFENGTTGIVSGAITLNSDATIGLRDWYNNATARGGVISGNISGNGGLNINSGSGSGGTLTLSGSNTYSGNTTVTASILTAAKDYSLPGFDTAGRVSIGSTATLAVNAGGTGEFTSSELSSMLNNVTFASGAVASIDTTNATTAPELSTGISGVMGLKKAGSNTLILSGNNSYTGSTTISGGTLTMSGNNSTTGATTVSAGTLVLSGSNTSTGTTSVSGTLQLIANSGNGGSIVGGTNAAISAGSALTLNSGAALQLRGDVSTTFNAASLTISGGTINLDVNSATSGLGNTLTVGNSISQTAVSTYNLTGGNNYTLGLGAISSSGGGGATFNSNTAGVTLNVSSFTETGDNVDTVTFGGAGNTTIGTIQTATAKPSGVNGRRLMLVMNGSGTVTLAGSNDLNRKSNDGSQNVLAANNGTLVLDNSNALNASTTGGGLTFTVGSNTASGNNVSMFLGDSTHSGGGLAISRSFTVEDLDTGTITVGGQNTSGINTYSGNFTMGATANTGKSLKLVAAVGGEVDFTGRLLANGTDITAGVSVGDVTNTGSVKLTGNNTYAGVTAVNGGTLIVSGSLSASTDVEIAAAGKLQLNTSGLITTSGTVNVNGLLSLNGGRSTVGTLNLANGSTFSVNITGTASTAYGSVSTIGGVNLATDVGGVTLSLNTIGYTPSFVVGDLSQSDHFVLTLGNGTPSTGSFVNVTSRANSNYGTALNEFTDAGGNSWAIFYNVDSTATNAFQTTGNDMVAYAIAVPEPGTWAMMLGGLGMLITYQRSRRRKL